MGYGIILLLSILSIQRVEAAQTLTVKYTCSDTGVLKFTASGTATLVNVHAKDKKDTCGTGVTTAADKVGFTGPTDGKVVGEFTDAKSAACGYIKDPADGPIRKVTVYLMVKADRYSADDRKVDFVCDISKPNTEDKVADVSTIDGIPADASDAISLDGDANLKVIKDADDADLYATPPINSAQLGDMIVIVSTISTAGLAKKVYIGECTAKSSDDTLATTFKITDDKGCSYPTDGVFADNTQKGKTDIAGNDKYSYKTPAFEAFRFLKGDGVKFTCTIKICGDGDQRCDIPNVCPVAARRRRAAGLASQHFKNRTLSQIIYIGYNQPKINGAVSHKDVNLSSCLSHVSFISVVAILAVLLVVSLAVSVFFCSKLIRQNNNNQQKEAYPNPAYKA